MWAIWTEAQPTLKIAGKVQYQIASFWSVSRKPGVEMKMPKKAGNTSTLPMKYQVLRLPGGQLNLSLSTPTIGVVIPSVIYPERRPAAAILGGNSTT
jgi:hypothetical protein